MVKTIGAARAAEKWATRAAGASKDYTDGVRSPKVSWQSAAQAAQSNYQTAVSSGDIGARFAAGVGKATDAKWSAMAQGKGAQRYPAGITAGKTYYSSGIQDVIAVQEATPWVRPGPKGSSANYAIVQTLGDALHAMKVGRT